MPGRPSHGGLAPVRACSSGGCRTGEGAEKKKRRKKAQPSGGNIRILDQDTTGFRAPGTASALAADGDEQENDEGEWMLTKPTHHFNASGVWERHACAGTCMACTCTPLS